MAGIGGTRTAEMRDTRRRVLENDRKGIENLLSVTAQSRVRLEEDVRQADLLVTKLRQRLFPLIDKEIEKINPPDGSEQLSLKSGTGVPPVKSRARCACHLKAREVFHGWAS